MVLATPLDRLGDSAGATNDLFEHTAAHEVIVAFHGEEIPLFIHAGEVRKWEPKALFSYKALMNKVL